MPTSTRSGLKAHWWVLILLPLFAGGGWALGHFSGSDLPPEPLIGAPEVRTAGDARVKQIRARASAYRARMAGNASNGVAPGTPPPAETGRAERSNWTSIDNAIAESRRNGKPVLLDFNAAWCGPCREMKRTVFDDWHRGDAVRDAVIPVSVVDRRREDGQNPPEVDRLEQQYRIDAFPTLVVFNPRNGRYTSTRGFGGADYTVQWIENAARQVR